MIIPGRSCPLQTRALRDYKLVWCLVAVCMRQRLLQPTHGKAHDVYFWPSKVVQQFSRVVCKHPCAVSYPQPLVNSNPTLKGLNDLSVSVEDEIEITLDLRWCRCYSHKLGCQICRPDTDSHCQRTQPAANHHQHQTIICLLLFIINDWPNAQLPSLISQCGCVCKDLKEQATN